MSTSVALKKETETTTCGYCNTQNSVFVMCVGYHLACQACRDEFRICPICFGDYLPFDDVRMKTMVKPDGKAPNKMNINPARIRSVAPIVQSASKRKQKFYKFRTSKKEIQFIFSKNSSIRREKEGN